MFTMPFWGKILKLFKNHQQFLIFLLISRKKQNIWRFWLDDFLMIFGLMILWWFCSDQPNGCRHPSKMKFLSKFPLDDFPMIFDDFWWFSFLGYFWRYLFEEFLLFEVLIYFVYSLIFFQIGCGTRCLISVARQMCGLNICLGTSDRLLPRSWSRPRSRGQLSIGPSIVNL